MASSSDVKRMAREKGIEFFLASFVEMTGASKAKLVPAEHLEALATEGAGFAGFAAGGLGQGPHDPGISAVPDLGSFPGPPWRPQVAWLGRHISVHRPALPLLPPTPFAPRGGARP